MNNRYINFFHSDYVILIYNNTVKFILIDILLQEYKLINLFI